MPDPNEFCYPQMEHAWWKLTPCPVHKGAMLISRLGPARYTVGYLIARMNTPGGGFEGINRDLADSIELELRADR